jgi:hypothetical protein
MYWKALRNSYFIANLEFESEIPEMGDFYIPDEDIDSLLGEYLNPDNPITEKIIALYKHIYALKKELISAFPSPEEYEDPDDDLEQILLGNIWTGYCPESAIKGKLVKMRLNSSNLYESEETGLQIAVFASVQAIILKTRGCGQFRTTITYGHEIANGEMLSPQNIDRPPFNSPTEIFDEKNRLEDYLEAIE